MSKNLISENREQFMEKITYTLFMLSIHKIWLKKTSMKNLLSSWSILFHNSNFYRSSYQFLFLANSSYQIIFLKNRENNIRIKENLSRAFTTAMSSSSRWRSFLGGRIHRQCRDIMVVACIEKCGGEVKWVHLKMRLSSISPKITSFLS